MTTVKQQREVGLAWFREGKFSQAQTCFRHLISTPDGTVHDQHNLAICLLATGGYAEAEQSLREVIRKRPMNASAHANLGTCLCLQDKRREPLAAFTRAVELAPKVADYWVRLAEHLLQMGELQEAETCYGVALSEAPANLGAIGGMAQIRERQGRSMEAMSLLYPVREQLCSHPNLAVAFAITCRSLELDSEARLVLEQVLQGRLSRNTRQLVVQTLAGILDRQGETHRAFETVCVANDLRGLDFDLMADSRRTDWMISHYTADFFQTLPDAGNPSELPVFLVGMPRSGTSLAEQILSRHSQVHGAGELPHLFDMESLLAQGGHDSSTLATRHLQELEALSPGAARVTDKMPHNTHHLATAARLFPGARVIWCRRDPMDTCLSAFFQNLSAAYAYTTNLGWLGARFKECERLMQHWQRVLPLPIYELSYEDLVQSPGETIRDLLEFCGLNFEEACLSPHLNKRVVHTASWSQVRKPIYTSSVGRARSYHRHLQPLCRALGLGEDWWQPSAVDQAA